MGVNCPANDRVPLPWPLTTVILILIYCPKVQVLLVLVSESFLYPTPQRPMHLQSSPPTKAYFFLAGGWGRGMLHGIWDLNSPTRDRMHAPCSSSVDSLTTVLPGKSQSLPFNSLPHTNCFPIRLGHHTWNGHIPPPGVCSMRKEVKSLILSLNPST